MGNGVRQGGVISDIFLNYNLNEILTDISILLLGCEFSNFTLFSGNKVNIFCYTDDFALPVSTETTLQCILYTLVPRLEKNSLKSNVVKSCNNVYKHNSEIKSTIALVMWNGQNILYLTNPIQYTKKLVRLIPTSCYIFCGLYGNSPPENCTLGKFPTGKLLPGKSSP